MFAVAREFQAVLETEGKSIYAAVAAYVAYLK